MHAGIGEDLLVHLTHALLDGAAGLVGEILELGATLLEGRALLLELGLDGLLAVFAEHRILAALLDAEQLGLELFDHLDALTDGSLGGFLGLADFRLEVDGLGVFLEDLLFVEQAHVGGGRVDGSGGEEEREEGLHEGGV